MKVSVSKVTSEEEINTCFSLRNQIFVIGQNVPVEEELDGLDKVSEHYLLVLDGVPVGVARVRFVEYYAKIERMGILDEYQGKGLGRFVMQAILEDLQQQRTVVTVKLSAQTHAISFYEKLGFELCSEEYIDAGIPHRDMMMNFIQHIH